MIETLNIEYLKPLYEDEPQALIVLIQEAVNESAALIDAIERTAGERSAKALDAAHELKGVCRTTGANELASIAEEIESWAKAGAFDQITARVGELRAAHRRLAEAATELRS